MLKQKLKATLMHLVISAFVISIFLLIVFYIWYPSSYSEVNGLGDLLTILIAVDLILGPLLTFVVYKKHKATLKFDLSVIASIQLIALAYGIFTIHQGHPAYIVYAVDRFELVPANEVSPERANYDEFKITKLWFPKLAYAKSPEDPKEKERLAFEALSGMPDLERRTEYYEPIDKYIGKILEHGIAESKLFSTKDKQEKLRVFLAKNNKQESDYAYLPLVGKSKDVVIAVSRESGEIAGTIDIDPWVKG